MKTKLTYITFMALLMVSAISFAQEGESSNSDYQAQRSLDSQNEVGTAQEDDASASNSSRSVLAPNFVNYQAVARDGAGNPIVSAAVTIDFDIHEGTAAGPVVFSETQNVNTDPNGVFSTAIGNVNPLNVAWGANSHFLEVSLNGTSVGTTLLATVPYAMSANTMPINAIIGEGADDADVVTIVGAGSELVDIRSSAALGSANDLLNLEMAAGSDPNAQFIEGRVDGTLAFQIQGDGRMLIESTTTAPQLNTIYGNSVPIAYGSIDSAGGISTGYGITSVTNPATGLYLITLDHDTNAANSIITVTPFTGSFGSPEIAGYSPVSANEIEVRVQNTAGAAVATAFAFMVFGNQ